MLFRRCRIFWHLPSVSLRCFSRRSYWGENTGSHSAAVGFSGTCHLCLFVVSAVVHTGVKTPDLIRTPKLSTRRPGWGTAWEPHGNDGFFFCRAQQIFLENVRDVPVRMAKLSTGLPA